MQEGETLGEGGPAYLCFSAAVVACESLAATIVAGVLYGEKRQGRWSGWGIASAF